MEEALGRPPGADLGLVGALAVRTDSAQQGRALARNCPALECV